VVLPGILVYGHAPWTIEKARMEGERQWLCKFVMDTTGDSRHEFNAADAVEVAKAAHRFKQLTEAGFTAAVRTGKGRSELIRNFDADAEETVFFARLQGG
jgi:hypothetical protein